MRVVSSTTLLGVVLAVSMFGAGVVADRLTSVYITNLPLDEQGNLKVKVTESSLQVFRDAVRISALATNVAGWASQGVMISVSEVTIIPFAFNPKGSHANVTGFSIFLIYYGGGGTLAIQLNDIPASNVAYHTTNSQSLFKNITDTSVYKAFKSGTNFLRLEIPTYTGGLYIQELTLFIEYEYQA